MMFKYLPMWPFAGAILLLACAKSDPVAENAVAPSDAMLGDASATGLAAPANSGAAEAVRQAALPAASGGLAWTMDQANRKALFGPPGTPAFSIQCQLQREGPRQLIFVRHLPPANHPAFFASSPLTLNVTRADMARMGWCPSGRLWQPSFSSRPLPTSSSLVPAGRNTAATWRLTATSSAGSSTPSARL